VVAVAQYLTDLGVSLSAAGHEVTVLCSSHGYDNPADEFPRNEEWEGIRIRRVPMWGTGKEVEGSTDCQFYIILPFKFCPFNADAKTGCSGRGATAATSCLGRLARSCSWSRETTT
jgi:hypothetical protein